MVDMFRLTKKRFVFLLIGSLWFVVSACSVSSEVVYSPKMTREQAFENLFRDIGFNEDVEMNPVQDPIEYDPIMDMYLVTVFLSPKSSRDIAYFPFQSLSAYYFDRLNHQSSQIIGVQVEPRPGPQYRVLTLQFPTPGMEGSIVGSVVLVIRASDMPAMDGSIRLVFEGYVYVDGTVTDEVMYSYIEIPFVSPGN